MCQTTSLLRKGCSTLLDTRSESVNHLQERIVMIIRNGKSRCYTRGIDIMKLMILVPIAHQIHRNA